MKIPKFLLDLAERKNELYGKLMRSVTTIKPLLERNSTPFFPEYTKHGIDHVEMVITTATNLIGSNCRGLITAEDATVLILSCLLHDAAMHLTEDGFLNLINSESSFRPIKGFSDVEWNILWENFLIEASRYDQRQLHGLFGDTEPVHRPKDNPQNWTRKDRLLIGEFIRKNHGRLAHEIAVYGIPGPGPHLLELDTDLEELKDLSGIVARSHSLPVRACLPYLKAHYDLRDYKNVHAVFLMVLLRVSDYLQIDAERAPEEYLKIQRLRSPISKKEWDAHNSIKNIHHNHEDPEAIYIHALPEKAETFLKVKEWLCGIQEEIDWSWAVLGEIYGRYDLKALSIVLRRVRSNLDDINAFADSVNYVPARAQFSTASADLLKLLIGPLYGNKPEVGVRELLQNSIDAVLERNEVFKKSPGLRKEFEEIDADVIVNVCKDSDGTSWISIKDYGIGMTVDTVTNYFLKAGASFRKSDEWRANFEDSNHKSKVHRSGRFGVGALAAFLLGDEIEVITKNIFASPDKGILFKSTVDTEIINMEYGSAEVGTTIKINISENVYQELCKVQLSRHKQRSSWDWYCLDTVRVKRTVDKIDGDLKQKYLLPGPSSKLSLGWHRLDHQSFSDLQWTYNKKVPYLTCNGLIVVDEKSKYIWKDMRYAEYYWAPESVDNVHIGNNLALIMPKLSVFDPDGNLPLTLQRNELGTKKYPFEEQLLQETVKDFISFALVKLPDISITPNSVSDFFKTSFPGLKVFGSWCPFFTTQNGISLVDEWNISNIGVKRGIMLPVFNKQFIHPCFGNGILNGEVTFLLGVDEGNPGISSLLRFLMGASLDYDVKVLSKLPIIGRRILMPKEKYDYFMRWRNNPNYLKRQINVEWSNDRFILLKLGNCPENGFDFGTLIDGINVDSETPLLIAEWYFGEIKNTKEASPISNLWNELLGRAEIPFDHEQRKAVFAGAYNVLDVFVKSHQAAAL